MQFEPNQTIADKYILEKKLGEGGIAVVYKMRHIDLETPFAIKILKVSTPSLKQRLELEAKVQAQLRHPNIVGVTDVIREEKYLGLVMEFVEGVGLDDLLLDRTLSTEQTEKIFLDILDGLEEAHDNSIIHRDLKPGNVMVKEKRGRFQVKICDFGLAKALDDEGASNTVTGTAMGTPAYMAPEQIRNAKNVDERADIFSMGVILYEMLSGEKPFNGSSHMDIMTAVVSRDPVPIESLKPDLPLRYVRAINGALHKNRHERIQNCAAFRAILLDETEGIASSNPEPEMSDSIIMDGLDLMSGDYSDDNLQDIIEENERHQMPNKPDKEEISLYDISGVQELKREEFIPTFKPKPETIEPEMEKSSGETAAPQPPQSPLPSPSKVSSDDQPAPMEDSAPVAVPPSTKNNGPIIFLVASVIIALGALGFAFMSKQEKQASQISEAKEVAVQEEDKDEKTEPIEKKEAVMVEQGIPPEIPPKEEKQAVVVQKPAEKQEVKKKTEPNITTPAPTQKLDSETAKAVVSQFDSKTRGSTQIQECFSEEQKKSGTAPTRVPLVVTLASSGTVTAAKISEGEYVGSSFEKCLQKKLQILTYQGFGAEFKPLKFRYTIKR